MTEVESPMGHQVELAGHFDGPVVLESVRSIGAGYECRVRLGGLDRLAIAGHGPVRHVAAAGAGGFLLALRGLGPSR